MIATIISADKATLHELDTVYGTEDAHNMLEVILVDAHNRRAMANKKDES